MHVIGARPNFVKAAPAIQALKEIGVEQTVVHTGQHFDESMSGSVLKELGINPKYNLRVSGHHPYAQIGMMVNGIGEVIGMEHPSLGIVYGDTNSTLAGALAFSKCNIPVAHVEAGLRSFDRTMPEEINRVLVDQISDLLFTHSENSLGILKAEGIPAESIHFVGNLMIDTLLQFLPNVKPKVNGDYVLITLHRPSNVDNPEKLYEILTALKMISKTMPVIFPVHPRTQSMIRKIKFPTGDRAIRFHPPFGYSDFLSLEKHAKLAITDSGGVQEETTYLGVPCLTLRPSTERPDTVYLGTNTLVPNVEDLASACNAVLACPQRDHLIPPLWDGKAAPRFAKVCADWLKNR